MIVIKTTSTPVTMKFCLGVVGVFYLLIQGLFAQSNLVGLPFITNHARNEYNAATQNWAIAQDSSGIMYFANSGGILQFDGNHWELFPMSNRSLVRTVYIGSDNRVYAGGFEEFGYLEAQENGKLKFKSLYDLFPAEHKHFGEIWKIIPDDNGIYIHTFTHWFYFDGKQIIMLESNRNMQFSYIAEQRLFVQDKEQGLLEKRGKKLIPVPGGEIFKGDIEIWAVEAVEENVFWIITQKNGIWEYDNLNFKKLDAPIYDVVVKSQVFSVERLKNGNLVFGTIKDGIVISDENGNVLHRINKENGLQNNTVLSVFQDMAGQLWLGLDNGIDYVEINSAFSRFDDGLGIEGTGYAAEYYKGYLYLATNQGLYAARVNREMNPIEDFELIEGTTGQVWCLNVVDSVLFMGHNTGAYIVKNKTITNIDKHNGYWNFMLSKTNPNFILAGNYSFLAVFEKLRGKWVYRNKIDGLDESCRVMVQDLNNIIWISHGYKGVFKCKISDDFRSFEKVDFYDNKHGLPSNIDNYVYEFNLKPVVATSDGIYQFINSTGKFYPDKYAKQIFRNMDKIRSITFDSDSNLWFVHEGRPAVLLRMPDLTFQLIDDPFRKLENQFINGFENLKILPETKAIYGVENGFILFDLHRVPKQKDKIKVFIRDIILTQPFDSVIFGGQIYHDSTGLQSYIPKINYEFKNIKIRYAATWYENASANKYRYILVNNDKYWSEWSLSNVKEYTNLDPGEYTFKVEALNIYTNLSNRVSYTFVVLPPWYKTKLAYSVYFIFMLIVVYSIIGFQSVRLRRAKDRLERSQKEELLKQEEEFNKEAIEAERQIIKLRNDMLQSEITKQQMEVELKNKEIASVAIQITHKNEMLNMVRRHLDSVLEKILNPQAKTEIEHLMTSIDQDLKLDDDWIRFKKHFDEVHSDFFIRLEKQFIDLTPKDLKMCAYLRLNLSSKEIASLLNISVRGVEISRYRLRKKLNLPKDVNLVDYMMHI